MIRHLVRQFHKHMNYGSAFSDHQVAFKHKSMWELVRALVVLRACGINFFVDNCLQLFEVGQRLLGSRVLGAFLGPTVYRQFVSGQKEEELARTYKKLEPCGLRLMVAPALEEDVNADISSQDKYDRNLEEMLKLTDITHRCGGKEPCLQLKMTGMFPAVTLKHVSSLCSTLNAHKVEQISAVLCGGSTSENIMQGLDQQHYQHFMSGLQRLATLGQAAVSNNVHIMVDAEYSYVKTGCNLLTLAMMVAFNQKQPLIANTYQCYFKDEEQTVEREILITKEIGTCFAAKIVRGAYLEKERKLKNELVCSSYQETCANYDKVIKAVLPILLKAERRPFLVIATHNEQSVIFALEHFKTLNLDPQDGRVTFGQIYGMAEQISLPLAHSGYIVYKSVPVGTMQNMLPYLARRVAENRSVLKGARKERELLQKEIKYRLQEKLHLF